jgi:hypothetical protein
MIMSTQDVSKANRANAAIGSCQVGSLHPESIVAFSGRPIASSSSLDETGLGLMFILSRVSRKRGKRFDCSALRARAVEWLRGKDVVCQPVPWLANFFERSGLDPDARCILVRVLL